MPILRCTTSIELDGVKFYVQTVVRSAIGERYEEHTYESVRYDTEAEATEHAKVAAAGLRKAVE